MHVPLVDVAARAARGQHAVSPRRLAHARATAWLLGDLAACTLAVSLVQWAALPEDYLQRILATLVFWLAGLAFVGAYSVRRCSNIREEARRVALGALAGAVAGTVILGPAAIYSAFALAGTALALSASSRGLVRLAFRSIYAAGIGLKKGLIVGRGSAIADVIARLAKSPGTRIVGVIGDDARGAPILGSFDDLAPVVAQTAADTVFLVPNAMDSHELEVVLAELDGLPVDIKIVPGVPRVHHARMHIMALGELSVVGVERAELSAWHRALKRGIDVAGSLAALTILAPVFAAIALATLIDDGRPVFYRQKRVGLKGKPFEMIKFRTMVRDADRLVYTLDNEQDGLIFKVREDPRITKIGRLLRKFSVDEFPQFINILKGEMSLVGPRPPLPGEVNHYDRFLARRLNVRPGATGIWQISGRNDLPFEDYVRYDLTYVENWSVGLDFMIMLRTIPVLLFGKGAY